MPRKSARRPQPSIRALGFDRRVLFRLLAILALIWLGWLIVLGVGGQADSQEVEAEGGWTSGGSAALTRIATRYIRSGDSGPINWGEVKRASERALALNPLDTRALVLLGLATEAEGDPQLAFKIMKMAAARTLRDPAAHLWLFNRHIEAQELDRALYHADVTMRAQPEYRDELLPALVQLAQHPQGTDALVDVLAHEPPWRGWFLVRLLKEVEDPINVSGLYGALEGTSAPPSDGELRHYLDALVSAGHLNEAFFAWVGRLGPEERGGLDYLFNGDFSQPVTNLPFDWQLNPIKGAEVSLVGEDAEGGRRLQVQFFRGRVPFRHVRKLLMLPPGSYVFSGEQRAEAFDNSRGMVWRITCATDGGGEIAVSPSLRGTADWSAFEVEFEVPPDCPGQWLELRIAARVPIEQDVDGGSVSYRNLNVRRADPESLAAPG